MNLHDYTNLRQHTEQDTSISASELTDQTDRTLIYGYDVHRNTFHVYLQDGLIHRLLYRNIRGTEYDHEALAAWSDVRMLHPDKRVYPGRSDHAFCALLKAKGADVSYTTFEPVELDGEFYGVTA